MPLVLLLAAVGLQVWAWRRLQKRVLTGTITKVGALLQYGAWATAPIVLFTGLFLGAMGAEELTGVAIIPELIGRAALLLAGLLLGVALVGWVAFLIRCGLV